MSIPHALRYLARYLYGGVIAERDILRCKDGMVTFRYRDAKRGKPATRTLSGADFLWLLLQHVLPKGFQRARHFGFLHHNSRRALRLLLLHLRPTAQSASPPKSLIAPSRSVWCCACGGVMLILRRRMRTEAVPASALHRRPSGPIRRLRRRAQSTELACNRRPRTRFGPLRPAAGSARAWVDY